MPVVIDAERVAEHGPAPTFTIPADVEGSGLVLGITHAISDEDDVEHDYKRARNYPPDSQSNSPRHCRHAEWLGASQSVRTQFPSCPLRQDTTGSQPQSEGKSSSSDEGKRHGQNDVAPVEPDL